MHDVDKTIENIEQGRAWEETDEIVQVETKETLDKVIPVRLRAIDWDKLRKEARELGVGPTTLARMWILERLRRRSISNEEIFSPLTQLVYDKFRANRLATLTERELEILEYVAQGNFSKQLAKKIGLNEEDIKSYLEEIIRKLNVGNEHILIRNQKTKYNKYNSTYNVE